MESVPVFIILSICSLRPNLVKMSQSNEEAPRGTETRLWNGAEIISETDGPVCWRAKKRRKSYADRAGSVRNGGEWRGRAGRGRRHQRRGCRNRNRCRRKSGKIISHTFFIILFISIFFHHLGIFFICWNYLFVCWWTPWLNLYHASLTIVNKHSHH